MTLNLSNILVHVKTLTLYSVAVLTLTPYNISGLEMTLYNSTVIVLKFTLYSYAQADINCTTARPAV